MFQNNQKEKRKSSCGWSFGQQMYGTYALGMFICGSEDHIIAKSPKPQKDNEKRRKQVHFNEKGNRACDNSENNDDHKIYAYMAQISSDDEQKKCKVL